MDMKKKKSLFGILAIVGILSVTIGVSLAFFNYTRTGAANTVSVGRIAFVTRQTETINLTNLFPIDPTETGIMDDTTKVGTVEIEIEGDTDYVDGVEYLVSSVNSSITTSTGKTVPISLDVAVTNLGTSSNNYFTAREDKNATIYKKLVGDTLAGDQMLLVGYIKPNTTSGTAEGIQNGKLTIKAYLDKNKILISDTYDGTESDNMGTPNSMARGKTVLTTTEWNALSSSGVSFQIKVEANEGIWVNGSLEEIMKKDAVMDNISSEYVNSASGIDFGAISSDTNGKGVYMRAGTQNDAYPIVYYRGAVEDNNVIFNNKCWKAVRTTDTGGVKLLYNGELSTNKKELTSEEYGTPVTNTGSFTYDSTDNTWNATVSTSSNVEVTFNVPTAGNYQMLVTGTYGSGSLLILKDEGVATGTGGPQDTIMIFNYDYGALTTSNKIGVRASASSEHPYVLKVKVLYEDSTLGTGCNNMGTTTGITVNNTNSFAFSGTNLYKSPAYNGYMWGTVYEYKSGSKSGTYWSDVQYNGTVYELKNGGTTNGSLNTTHHYICEDSSNCTKLRYYYYNNYYIELENGDTVESALEKMQTNTNPSNAKTQIDAWYASYMNTVTNKLEDTVWCNDRSMGDGNNSGWIANGGSLSEYLYYGAYQRSNYASNSSTVKNQPSLACANKNDAFTVTNGSGNQKLQYPVAMLTADEMVLAGDLAGAGSYSYINSGSYSWSLSPSFFNYNYAREFYLYDSFIFNNTVSDTYGLRPSVSLKPGTPVVSGDGTASSPYVIGS